MNLISSRLLALILGLSFSARETVATDTLNSLAMSFIVMGVFFSGIENYFTKQKYGKTLLFLLLHYYYCSFYLCKRLHNRKRIFYMKKKQNYYF